MTHRVALIGCGMIARAHAYGWQSCDGAEIIALADHHPGAVAELGDAVGLPGDALHADYRAMLDATRPDIVVISLWHAEHANAVLAAASRGVKLIVCEKPMAPSLGDAEAMIVACRRAGAKLAIAHQRRFYPGWERARELVSAGAIGEPTYAHSGVRDGLLNNGTHTIDLVRYILGDRRALRVVGTVHRHTDRHERGRRAEDSAIGVVEFDGGVRLVVESDLDSTSVLSANVVLVGTGGMIRIEENCVEVLDGRAAGWQRVCGVPLGTTGQERPETAAIRAMVPHFGVANGEEFADNFPRQAAALVDWLDRPDLRYRGEAGEGYASLEIIMALYESARLREVTSLPLHTRENPLDLMVESGALPVLRPGRYDIRSMLVRGESMSW